MSSAYQMLSMRWLRTEPSVPPPLKMAGLFDQRLIGRCNVFTSRRRDALTRTIRDLSTELFCIRCGR